MGNDTENIKILCIGVGGAGTNVINRMKDIGIPNGKRLRVYTLHNSKKAVTAGGCNLNCVKACS